MQICFAARIPAVLAPLPGAKRAQDRALQLLPDQLSGSPVTQVRFEFVQRFCASSQFAESYGVVLRPHDLGAIFQWFVDRQKFGDALEYPPYWFSLRGVRGLCLLQATSRGRFDAGAISDRACHAPIPASTQASAVSTTVNGRGCCHSMFPPTTDPTANIKVRTNPATGRRKSRKVVATPNRPEASSRLLASRDADRMVWMAA